MMDLVDEADFVDLVDGNEIRRVGGRNGVRQGDVGMEGDEGDGWRGQKD